MKNGRGLKLRKPFFFTFVSYNLKLKRILKGNK